jgi:hypothetical protein
VQTIPSFDLYRELEVDPAASSETIDAAWKSLLKRLHPDVAGDATAADRVKRLNLAHEWLADPEKRARYDRQRRRPGVYVVPRPTTSPPPPAAEPAAPRPEHNPYAEYPGPRPRPPAAAVPPSPPRPRLSRSRYSTILAPLAFASVIIVVAASAFFGSTRFPTAAAESTPTATATPVPASTQLGALASAAANPRGLPPPNVAAAVPASCRHPRYSDALTFETRVRSAPGQVVVVGCDGGAYGPLLFVAGTDRWQLLADGGTHDSLPVGGFAGGLSGESADEFGIAWARDEGVRATVTLYRMTATLNAYWDSASIGLQWTLASFAYRPAPDPTAPGSLVVIEADLASGTAGCTICHDHQLYREFYEWRSVTGRGQLVRISREPFGVGPS